jgi:hypothetical protein
MASRTNRLLAGTGALLALIGTLLPFYQLGHENYSLWRLESGADLMIGFILGAIVTLALAYERLPRRWMTITLVLASGASLSYFLGPAVNQTGIDAFHKAAGVWLALIGALLSTVGAVRILRDDLRPPAAIPHINSSSAANGPPPPQRPTHGPPSAGSGGVGRQLIRRSDLPHEAER